MVGSNIKSLGLLAILAISVCSLLCHNQIKMVEAEDCDVDLNGFVIECMYFIHKGDQTLKDPNDRCCNVIKKANLPCCCNNINKKLFIPPVFSLADMIEWKKMLHCLNFCGKPLAPGTKCGSFTVPAGPPSK